MNRILAFLIVLMLILIGLMLGFLLVTGIMSYQARAADLKIEPPVYQLEKHKPLTADCDSLRDLNRANKGRKLSEEEKVVKAQLFTWYNANCRQARK